ncbi:MAG: SAM-dependent chlorinase/fluorinase, partial [Acidobacteria bacterium]|nr:SAM-dependent chlorinase/fluorinase [Acidobacteriota bacterium]
MSETSSATGSPTIALLTDFGLTDAYVGTLKGVLRSIAPEAALIDLTHNVPPRSILVGAALLSQSAPFFPRGTVFLAVVDPGVGTDRRALAASSGGMFYVAPDNGLLTFVLREDARIHELENRDFALQPVSA